MTDNFESKVLKSLFQGKGRYMARVLYAFFVGLLLLAPVNVQAQDGSTADIIMQLILEDPSLVPEGSVLVGPGSWAWGKNYIDPLTRPFASDHDKLNCLNFLMRLPWARSVS